MACDNIVQVKDKDGNWVDSTLFLSLLENAENRERAMELYRMVHGTEFRNWYGDWTAMPLGERTDINGEPVLTEGSFVGLDGSTRSIQNGDSKLYSVGTLDLQQSTKLDTRKGLVAYVSDKTRTFKRSAQAVADYIGNLPKTEQEKLEEKLTQEIGLLRKFNKPGVEGRDNSKRIESMEATLIDIQRDNDIYPFVGYAQSELEEMEAFVKDNSPSNVGRYDAKVLSYFLNQLKLFERVLDAKHFTIQDKALDRQREAVLGRVSTLHNRLRPYINEVVIARIEQATLDESFRESIIDYKTRTVKRQRNPNWFEKTFLDSSLSPNYLNQIALMGGHETDMKSMQELESDSARLDVAYKELLESQKGKNDFSWMYEDPSDEEISEGRTSTGKIVYKYRNDFRIRLAKLSASMLEGKAKVQDWLDAVTEGTNDVLVPHGLRSALNLPDMAEPTATSPADKKYAEYVRDRDRYILAYGEEEAEKWILLNDPVRYISFFQRYKNGDRSFEVTDYFQKTMKSHRGVFPWVYHQYGESFLNPKWNTIQTDPIRKEFYDAFNEINGLSDNDLPEIVGRDGEYVDRNDVWELPRTFDERLISEGVPSVLWKEVKSHFRSAVIESDSTETKGYIDPHSGEIRYSLYIPQQSGNKTFEEKSGNLYHVAKAKRAVSLFYKHKSGLEPVYDLLKDLSQETGYLNAKGEERFDDKGSAFAQLDYSIKNDLGYGGQNKEGMKAGMKALTKEEKERETVLVEELEELLSAHKENPHDANIVRDIRKKSKELDRLGSQLSYRATVDFINEYTRRKGLSLSMVSGVTDAFFGFTSLLIEATGQNFSTRDVMAAYGSATRYLAHNGVHGQDKVTKLAKVLALEDKVSEAQYASNVHGKRSRAAKLWDADNFYVIQKMSGRMNAYATMIALARNRTITVNGETVPLWKAFDENGNWMLAGPDPLSPNASEDVKQQFVRHSMAINAIIANVHGNFDPRKPLMVNREIWGRCLMTFKRWLPNAIEARMGKEKYNLLTGQVQKGRYRSVGSLFMDEGNHLKSRAEVMEGFLQVTGIRKEGRLSDLNVYNLRRLGREMLAWALLGGIVAVLKGIADNDEDEPFLTYLINQNNRVVKDLAFLMNPIHLVENYTGWIPIAGTVLEFYDLMEMTMQYALDPDNPKNKVKRGKDKGDLRVVNKALDQIIGIRAIRGTIGLTEEIADFKPKR